MRTCMFAKYMAVTKSTVRTGTLRITCCVQAIATKPIRYAVPAKSATCQKVVEATEYVVSRRATILIVSRRIASHTNLQQSYAIFDTDRQELSWWDVPLAHLKVIVYRSRAMFEALSAQLLEHA